MPTTFASGLDDYPRALFPSSEEEHLDLLCWVAHGAALLSRIASQLQSASSDPTLASRYAIDAQRFGQVQEQLLAALEAVHWSERDQAYFDRGLTFPMPKRKPKEGKAVKAGVAMLGKDVVIGCGTSDGKQVVQVAVPYDYRGDAQRELDKAERRGCPASHPRFLYPIGDPNGNGLMFRKRVVATQRDGQPALPTVRLTKHIGYGTLFPLLLTLLDPSDEVQSKRLSALLNVMEDKHRLWSPHGLRSLSANDLFYDEENAPGDAPYWRGAIWMNINFLALRALKFYANHTTAPEALQSRASSIYDDLRANILRTVLGEWKRSKSLWEQYDDKSGQGRRSHPFTGWTALVLNIMAEEYAL